MLTSNQADTTISDLDRTDELPVLDVVAYEASLVESQKGLSRTDAWEVEALREADKLNEATQKGARLTLRRNGKEGPVTEKLTVNVDRILKRIAQLETDITAAQETNAVLQKRSKGLETERDQQVQRIRTLEAENARIAEVRMLSDERAESLERQLQTRKDMAARVEELEGSNDTLQDQVRAAASLADERATALGALEKSLTDEKTVNTQLSQQLAAKLKACDQLSTLAQQRDGVIAEKAQQLAEVIGELERAHGELESTRQERDEAQAQIRSMSEEHDERADELVVQLQSARDEQAAMGEQLGKLRTRIKSLTQQVFSRDNEISELRADLAVHTEALDAIRRDVNRIGTPAEEEPLVDVERVLEPVEHAGEPIVLNRRSFTIGRTHDNDICLHSHLISRHHARLLVGPTGVIIEDAGSTNGCFVNGEEVRHHLMHEGDVLELGDLRYCLRTRSATDTKVRVGAARAPSSSPAASAALPPMSV